MRSLALMRLTLVALCLPAGLLAQASPATSSDASVLTPGDSVRIVVWRKPELSGDFVVGTDGTITHPLYRSVQVAGVPVATAEANVRNFLARFEESPQFVMEPLLRVAVSGEVSRPQVFAVRPGTSIAETVARAGGATQFAKRDEVRLLRTDRAGRQQELHVDLMNPERGLANAPVRSGDLIVLERRTAFFRDIVVPGLSVIGALASIIILVDRNTN
jgi:polysaccharide export outer membrane protein